MLFNSLVYILLFLPVCVLVYFGLIRIGQPRVARLWLVLASFFFYAYWVPKYIGLLLASIGANFFLGQRILAARHTGRDRAAWWWTFGGIAFNVLLLGVSKYTDFVLANVNLLLGLDIPLPNIPLPLAISFFTFQQIAYLADCHREPDTDYHIGRYSLFVCFFPQLIAGPIVHHKEMMPQFRDNTNMAVNWENIHHGVFLFAVGLFKKVVIADTLAQYATYGFDTAQTLTFLPAWAVSLCYTFQLYFDFSGYTDMAIGSALLFNIRLPQNFNSPYRALSIQDFWRRWHMTLSRFLRDYIYIPLGGNRKGQNRMLLNLFLTFLIGGIWHGAGWTFVIWGALHGAAMVVQRLWRMTAIELPKAACWLVTFLFVNFAWVFFRALDFGSAVKVLKGMAGLNGFDIPQSLSTLAEAFVQGGTKLVPVAVGGLLIVATLGSLSDVLFRDSNQWTARLRPTGAWVVFTNVLLIFSMYLILDHNRVTEFIYFNF